MQLDPGTPTKVVIRTAGHVAVVPAAAAELVAPILTADTPGIADGRLLKARVSKEFFELDDDGRLWTSAGLVPRISKHLERLGHRVTVDDRTTWCQYQKMDAGCLYTGVAGAEEKSLFAALASHPRGQIVVTNGRQLARTIALVTVAFPELNVLTVARNRKQRDGLHRSILELIDGNVCRCDCVDWQTPRLLLTTPFRFSVCAPRDWHIIFFSDASVALGEWASAELALMPERLFYACATANQSVGPRGSLEIESVFGPPIFEWPGPRGRLASVKVCLVPTTHAITNSGLDLAAKRRHIWYNDTRNDLIASIADAVVRADIEALELQGVPVDPEWFDGEKRPTLSILAESTEHAGELAKRLPAWRIGHDVPRNHLDADKSTDLNIATGDRTITTVVHAHRCGIGTDIIVRADGGIEWPIGPERFPRRQQREGDTVGVIDFETTAGPRHREDAYSKRGWTVTSHLGNEQT